MRLSDRSKLLLMLAVPLTTATATAIASYEHLSNKTPSYYSIIVAGYVSGIILLAIGGSLINRLKRNQQQ